MSDDGHQAAIEAIWQQQLPQTQERVERLRHVARDFSDTRSIEPGVQAEALDLAHKLAGSLGMFGYTDATDHAREIEQTLETDGMMPQPERLQQHVDALATSLSAALKL